MEFFAHRIEVGQHSMSVDDAMDAYHPASVTGGVAEMTTRFFPWALAR